MDFLKKFTDATKLGGSDETPHPHPTTTATIAAESNNPPSQTDLFASAQVVAEAAKAAISRDPKNVDNYKLAGATADILDAAEHYGKLDTSTGIGSYVEKAEGYLKKYETSNSTTSPPPKPLAEGEDTVVEPKSTTPPPPKSVAEGEEETAIEPKSTAPSHQPPVEASEEEETHETTTSPPPSKPAAPVAAEEEEVVSEKKELQEEEVTPPPPTKAHVVAEESETAPSSEIPAAGDDKSEGGIGDYVKKAQAEGYGGALKAAGDFWKKT